MKLDLSNVEEDAAPTLLEPGTYEIVVTDAIEGMSKSGKENIELSMEILAGDAKGRGIKDWVYITPAAMWRVGQVLRALDYTVPDGAFELNASQLIGKKASIVVKHEVYNDKIKTRVDEYARSEQDLPYTPVVDDGVPF